MSEAEVETPAQLKDRAMKLTLNNLTRTMLGGVLGDQYDGTRNIYEALGYNKNPGFEQFWAKYKHQDIASRVINSYPGATWQGEFKLLMGDGEPWKEAEALMEKIKLVHYFTRGDILARVGQYSVILIGYKDNEEDLSKEVAKPSDISYLRPYKQSSADIATFDSDIMSPRYGQPLTYTLQSGQTEGSGTDDSTSAPQQSVTVHYTRILHIAEGLLEDEVYGIPALESIYNRLDDLDKVLGGSAEMYWRGAFPGYALETEDNADLDADDLVDMTTEMDNYINSLNRYVRMAGVKVKEFTVQVVAPNQHVDALVAMISSAKAIPQRLLMGSERGELASSQDKKNWDERVGERREDFAEPIIVRPFLDAMVTHGILKPQVGYKVVWPPLGALDAKEQAEIAVSLSEAYKNYIESGDQTILIPERFLEDIMGYTKEEVEAILSVMDDDLRTELLEARQAKEPDEGV